MEVSKQNNIVEFQQVDLAYDKQVILHNLNFSIQKGEFVYLVGKTGSGKSSILKSIYGEIKPQKGNIIFDKFNLNTITKKELPYLRRRIGIVFQDFQLLSDRNVAENLSFAMKATGWTDSKKIKTQLNDILMKVGLSNKMLFMPHQLSGGEQQRTNIARALVNDPLLIIADEPTGNLDGEVARYIMDLLFKINRIGTAVLMATHDLSLISEYPARVLECKNGTLKVS